MTGPEIRVIKTRIFPACVHCSHFAGIQLEVLHKGETEADTLERINGFLCRHPAKLSSFESSRLTGIYAKCPLREVDRDFPTDIEALRQENEEQEKRIRELEELLKEQRHSCFSEEPTRQKPKREEDYAFSDV